MSGRDRGHSDARAFGFGCATAIAAVATVPLMVLFVLHLVRTPLSDMVSPGGQLFVRRGLPAQSLDGRYQCLADSPVVFSPVGDSTATWTFTCKDSRWGMTLTGSRHRRKAVYLSGVLDVPSTAPFGMVEGILRGRAAVPVGTDGQHFTNEELDISVLLTFEVRSPAAVGTRRLLLQFTFAVASLACMLLAGWFYRIARRAGLGQ